VTPSLEKFLQAGDHFARHSGVELVTVRTGHAVTRLVVQPCHLNAAGVVHGGAIFTLADFAFAAASNSHGHVALGINATITYQHAAKGGTLIAEATEVAANPKLGTYTVTVKDDDGRLVALFQGLVYRKKDTVPPVAGG
jgi:acyl-CoA thioesterase